jgi:hypothetical protein
MRLNATRLGSIASSRSFGDQLDDLAGQVPSLDLNFAQNKSLIDDYSGTTLVTHTRASSGTFVDSTGVLRSAVTNLLVRSEEFETTWTNTNSTDSTNVTVAPNGTLTADLLLANATTTASARDTRQNANGTVASTHTFSVYAKAKDGNFLGMTFRNQAAAVNFCSAEFNLSNGTVSIAGTNGGNATGALASITDIGNGWYRCSLSGIADTSGTQFTVIFIGRTSSNNNSVIADTELVYLWGAQLEQSSTVGDYVPTTSTINSAPRFDHNPQTGESLGLLVEEARTNLILRSEEFDNVSWTKASATITANESTAPDGTTTADLWTNTGSLGTVSQSYTKDATERTYSASIWVKSSVTAFTLALDSGSNTNRGKAVFNFATGVLTTIDNSGTFTNTSGTITAYPDSWYRVTVTTTTSTATTVRFIVFFSGTGATARIWGAQLEENAAFATSYIPTVAATVTRAADVASITGANFGSWYRQDEGTVFAESSTFAPTSSFDGIGNIGNSITPLIISLQRNGTNSRGFGAGVSIDQGSNTYPANTTVRQVIAAKVNDFALSTNASSIAADTSTDPLPTAEFLNFGVNVPSSTTYLNGHIRRLTYWPTRLSNEVLQRITQ